MNFVKSGNMAKQTTLLCTASLIVLSTGMSSPGLAQTSLPPVSVDVPKQKPRVQTSRSATASRTNARGARRGPARTPTAQAAPAPVPSLNERAYPGTHGYVADTASAGSKTNTPLIDTPRSVTVIDRKELDDRAVSNVVDAVRYTAGATTENYGFDPRFDEIQLRGFPVVTFGDFRDGLKQLPANFATWRTEPYQLSGIEIIKGPDAVLYGQSVPGGLIDRRSKLPVDNQVNEIELQGGTFGRAQAAFDIGGANQDKSMLWRLVGLGREGDTNYDIADKRLLLAPSLTWRPTVDTTITTYALLQKDETDANVAMINDSSGQLLRVNGKTLRSSDPSYDYMKTQQAQIGYKVEHRFDDIFTFRQNTRFGILHAESRYLDGSLDADNPTIFDRAPVSVGDDVHSWQTDNMLQADFATGPVTHKALFGVNYDYSVWDFKLGYGDVNPAYALDTTDPHYGISGPTTPYTSGLHSTQDQVGIYMQDQMKLGGWRLSVSGRQDWASRTQTDAFTGGDQQSRNDSAFSYSAGLLYHFDNGIAPYVSYATSFQPRTELGIDNSVLAPSTGKQIEAGIKYQPRRDVLLTASVYDLREKNAATIAGYLDGGVAYYESLGETRVQGFEFEARAHITPELETVTAYSYTDARITDSSDPTQIGNTPAVTPKNTASSWLNYTFLNGGLEGLGFGAGVRYVDATWTANDNTARNGAYTMADLALRYDFSKLGRQFKGYSASINVTNVANQEVAVCNTGYCYLTQGRTVIGSLRYRW